METFDWYTYVGLPLLVFLARLTDVTLGTMRIIFTSRGRRNLAPLLGFVEVFIWIAMVGQIVKSANSVTAYLGYAAGFAAGTYIGMKIEERLALGTLVMRIILAHSGDELAARLRAAGFGVTVVNGEGASGPVKVLYTVIKRKDLKLVTGIVNEITPKAFYSIEEVRAAASGIFPMQPAPSAGSMRKTK